MRIVLLTCAALLSLACSDETPDISTGRSVRAVTRGLLDRPAPFDRAKSAAIFVGIRRFDDKSVDDVPFAVDDAIDLAYEFALERKVGLVKPRNVVLVLSGAPQKPESEKRLQALGKAGAEIRRSASQADILSLLQRQAALAAEGGVLIVSIASHGFSHEGNAYILGASSTFPNVESALSTAMIAEIAGDSKARRSFLFLDACRERMQPSRSLGADPRTAAPLISRMSKHEGQVVLYAAANGKYAFDDFEKKNGVFTSAVLDGLRCSTARDAQGLVTVDRLAQSVEDYVHEWILTNRHEDVRPATQLQVEGKANHLPLAMCNRLPDPHRAVIAGSSFTARDKDNRDLWTRTLDAPITQAEVIDLDGDTENEVVVAVHDRVVAFDAEGKELWSADGGEPVRKIMAAQFYAKKDGTSVIAESGSRLAILGTDGVERTSLPIDGEIAKFVVDRPTARHAHRIIVMAVTEKSNHSVFLFDRKGVREWRGRVLPNGKIDIEVLDFDNDGRRDIAIQTEQGRIFVNFDGDVLHHADGAHFIRVK